MENLEKFEPDWTVCPGATILDILAERNISIKDFQNKTGKSEEYINKILYGKISISNDFAKILEDILGCPASFWINRDRQWVNDKKRLGIK